MPITCSTYSDIYVGKGAAIQSIREYKNQQVPVL